MFTKIGGFINIVLSVLGLSSPYPDVELKNLEIYRQNESVYAEFETRNLINHSIMQVMESGIDITIEFSINTVMEDNIIYYNSVFKIIEYKDHLYYLNEAENEMSFDLLTNELVGNNLIILTNVNAYLSKNILTTIEILIYGKTLPNLSDLWGNQPEIIIKYKL